MQSNKVTVTIRMESLSIDVLPVMLKEVIRQVSEEAENGKLILADGDQIEWETVRIPVLF